MMFQELKEDLTMVLLMNQKIGLILMILRFLSFVLSFLPVRFTMDICIKSWKEVYYRIWYFFLEE